MHTCIHTTHTHAAREGERQTDTHPLTHSHTRTHNFSLPGVVITFPRAPAPLHFSHVMRIALMMVVARMSARTLSQRERKRQRDTDTQVVLIVLMTVFTDASAHVLVYNAQTHKHTHTGGADCIHDSGCGHFSTCGAKIGSANTVHRVLHRLNNSHVCHFFGGRYVILAQLARPIFW
jgi:hypothetical protein